MADRLYSPLRPKSYVTGNLTSQALLPTAAELKYIDASNAAVLLTTPRTARYLLWLALLLVFGLLMLARIIVLDEVMVSNGKVITSKQVQVIQHVDGGILQRVHAAEGDIVAQGQTLLSIDAFGLIAELKDKELEYFNLSADIIRLKAELESIQVADIPLSQWRESIQINPDLLDRKFDVPLQQQNSYHARISNLDNELRLQGELIQQKEQDIIVLNSRVRHLRKSRGIVSRELNYTVPLAEEGLVSEIDLLKLKIKLSGLLGELENAKLLLPKAKLALTEAILTRLDLALDFRTEVLQTLNEQTSRLAQVDEIKQGINERIDRSQVKSPIRGIVSKIYITTIGGIIKPGMDLVEIVPINDALLIEARVAPKDRGFLELGLAVEVRFTAYDFAQYGGLKGTLEHISAYPIEDKGQSFYLIKVRAEPPSLRYKGDSLPILAGMLAEVDIITGKKRALDYLMKPVLRAKQRAPSDTH